MFGKSIELFKLFGFSVRIDWSWLIIAVLITWSLAMGLFPQFYPELQRSTYWIMGVAGALGLFVSIVLHEIGHALVARRYGVEMKGITLFIFGGVAQMKDEPPSAMAEFMIAIGGPVVTLVIGAVCMGLAQIGFQFGWPVSVRGVVAYLAFINGLLLAFNLIPAFPLDGGRVLRAILWSVKDNLKWATRVTATIGSIFGIALIFWGVFTAISINVISGMWWALLGLFLRGAAQMSYQQLLVRRALEGEPVSRFMHSEVHSVPPSATVQQFVDDYVYRFHHKMFPVTDNGTLVGCMTTGKLKDLPRETWDQHTVGELADPCNEENTIATDADATTALKKMTQDGNSRLVVVEDGRLRGIVSLKDMMKFISLKVELEGD